MDFLLNELFNLLPILVPLLWILSLATRRRKKAADKDNPEVRVIKSKKDAAPRGGLMERLAEQFTAGKNYIITEPDAAGRLEEADKRPEMAFAAAVDAPNNEPDAAVPGLKMANALPSKVAPVADAVPVSAAAVKTPIQTGGADALTRRLAGLSGPAQGMVWSVILGRPLGL
ncbi:MAG: hypothetical protein B0D92_01770 [Spirochaeta sp. LUC14_002_19_P3]|nr:MAG: hypothetical protein B0D92_01770 [Spirochaeta sp. LUC14_002_19_P3]